MVDKKREVKTHHGSSWSAVSSEPGQGAGPTGSLGSHHGIQQLPSSQAQASYITTMSSSSDTLPPIPPAPMLPQLEQALADRPSLKLLHEVAMRGGYGAELTRRLEETGLAFQEDLGAEIFELATLMGGAFMEDEERRGLLRRVVPLVTAGTEAQQQSAQLRALAVALGAPELPSRHQDALLDGLLNGVAGMERCPMLLVVYEVLGGHDMPAEQYVGFINAFIEQGSMSGMLATSGPLRDAVRTLASLPQLPPKRLHLLLDTVWDDVARAGPKSGGREWLDLVGQLFAGTPQMTVLQAWVVSKFTRRAHVRDEYPLHALVHGHASRVTTDDVQRSALFEETARFSMACLLAAAQAGASPRSTQELAWVVLLALKRCGPDGTHRSALLEAVQEVLPGLAPLHRMVLVMQLGKVLTRSRDVPWRQALCDALCGPSSASPGKADAKRTLEADDGPPLRDLVDLALRALEDPFELLRADLDDALRFECFEFAAGHAGRLFRSRQPPSMWNVPKDISAPMRLRYLLRLPDIGDDGFDVQDFVQVHNELMAAIKSDATWHEPHATEGTDTKASSSGDKARRAGAPPIQEVLRFYEAFEEAFGLSLDGQQGRLFPYDDPEKAQAKADKLRAALQEIVLAVRRSGDKAHSFARNRAVQFNAVLHRLEEMLAPLDEQVYSATSASFGFTSRSFRTLARDRILLAEHPDRRTAAVMARVVASGCPDAELKQIVQALLEDAPDEQTAHLMRRGVAEVLAKAHHGSSWSTAGSGSSSTRQAVSSASTRSADMALAPVAVRLQQALAADPALRLLHEVAMGQVAGRELARRLEETGLASRGDLAPEIAELATLMGGPLMDDEAREGLLRRVVPLSTVGGDLDQPHLQFSALVEALGGPLMAARHRDALVDSVLDGTVSREPSIALLVLFRFMGGQDMPDQSYVDFIAGVLDRAVTLNVPEVQFSKAIRHIARPEQPPERLQLLLETLWDRTARSAAWAHHADTWTLHAAQALAGTSRMSVVWAAAVSRFARPGGMDHDQSLYRPLLMLVMALHEARRMGKGGEPVIPVVETVMVNCVLPAARASGSPWTLRHMASAVFIAPSPERDEARRRSAWVAVVQKILPDLPPLHRMALVMCVGEVLRTQGDAAARRRVCEALCSPPSPSGGIGHAMGAPDRDDGPATRDLVDLALRALDDPFELLRADLDDSLRFASFEFVADYLKRRSLDVSRDIHPPMRWLDVPRDIHPLMRWRYLLRLFEIEPRLDVRDFVRIHTELMDAIEADASWHGSLPKSGVETKASGPRTGASQGSVPAMAEVLRFYETFQEAYGLRLDDASGRLFPGVVPVIAGIKAEALRAALQEIVLAVRRAGDKAHDFARDRATHFTVILGRLEEMLPPLEGQVDSALAVSSSDTGFLSRQFRTLARNRILLAEHPDKVMAAVLARVFASGRSETELRQIVQALFVDAPDKQTSRLMRKGVVEVLAQDTHLTVAQRAAVRREAGVTRESKR